MILRIRTLIFAGAALNEYLPVSDFTWIEEKGFVEKEWPNWTEDSNIGYIVECTLAVPSQYHDYMDSFPMAPTASVIKYSDLSPYSQQFVREGYKSTKLVCDLKLKEKYVVSGRNLNFYLSHGLRLVEVHRVLSFRQAPIAREMITYTTKLRGESQSTVMTAFLKFYNVCRYLIV